MLIGYLIGIAIISVVSALFIKLGVRLIGSKQVVFAKFFYCGFACVYILFVMLVIERTIYRL